MNVLELIEKEHRHTEKLFSDIEATDEPNELEKVFNQLYKQLNLHISREELIFYPAMRKYKEIEPLLNEAQEEHHEATLLLEEIKSLEPTSSEFKTKITELMKTVTSHVNEEENDLFPVVRQYMGDEELTELGTEFKENTTKLQKEISASDG